MQIKKVLIASCSKDNEYNAREIKRRKPSSTRHIKRQANKRARAIENKFFDAAELEAQPKFRIR